MEITIIKLYLLTLIDSMLATFTYRIKGFRVLGPGKLGSDWLVTSTIQYLIPIFFSNKHGEVIKFCQYILHRYYLVHSIICRIVECCHCISTENTLHGFECNRFKG